MHEFIQIATTTGDHAVAEQIATVLVDRRLAACVQISGPVTSTYQWQGKVETAEEWVCTAKSLADRFEDIAGVISELHSYDVPEIVATSITAASDSYAAWLRGELERLA